MAAVVGTRYNPHVKAVYVFMNACVPEARSNVLTRRRNAQAGAFMLWRSQNPTAVSTRLSEKCLTLTTVSTALSSAVYSSFGIFFIAILSKVTRILRHSWKNIFRGKLNPKPANF
jgi:hypothetical protein